MLKKIITTIILLGISLVPFSALANVNFYDYDNKEIINAYVDFVTSKEITSEIVINEPIGHKKISYDHIKLPEGNKEDNVNPFTQISDKFIVNRIDLYFKNYQEIFKENGSTYIRPDKKNLDFVIKDIDKRIERLFPNQEYKKLPSQEVAYIFFSDLLNKERIKYKAINSFYEYCNTNIDSYLEEKSMFCYQLGKIGEIAMLRMGIPAISLLGYLEGDSYHLFLTFYDKSSNEWLIFDPYCEEIGKALFYKKVEKSDFKKDKDYFKTSPLILDHELNYSKNYKEILLEKFKQKDH